MTGWKWIKLFLKRQRDVAYRRQRVWIRDVQWNEPCCSRWLLWKN
jgi:hypothetical protein